ncbi:hypothetical protein K435DRAFT_820621 [Dendrothele bispora CBS 962.96]|uniref:DUF6570 domain-containing protein n=1 Tax=Dendrothele bispora (strain CBS 962.96) TaxID=1314807 RepID=A0A4S8LRB8_DENBC|nr:hypothetical protein K435DRAFT_820621 [Dendrothele bispora CBS 962.96]
MIARCRSKAWVVKLHDNGSGPAFDANNMTGINENNSSAVLQRGVKGHIIIYPQNPTSVLDLLPPPVEDLCTGICVIFVGSRPPSQDWLKEKATPLIFRKEKLQRALEWLKTHNPLYRDVRINQTFLDGLQDEEILPVEIEHVHPDPRTDVVNSSYDNRDDDVLTDHSTIAFERVVVSDVSGNESSTVLKRAASKHVRQKHGSYIRIPHGSHPASEFDNHSLFPMMYPTLFPYGLGGFGLPQRLVPVSMKSHLKEWLKVIR